MQGSTESDIGFELWLPVAANWNRRFLGAGVGGEAGKLNYLDMARGLNRGFATASTDTGHRIEDRNWAFRRPDRRANFAGRANHLLAQRSKDLIRLYYGRPPSFSYFVGCSGGGREGLKESQTYPEDYNGILAGSAGPDQMVASLRLLWMQYVMEPTHSGLMSAADWRLISKSAVRACDVADGLANGMIENPVRCAFRVRDLLCLPEQKTECLTQAQVDYAEKVFAPMRDEVGTELDPGIASGVTMLFEPRSSFAFTLYGTVTHDNPSWDPLRLNMHEDLKAARRAWPDLSNDNPDLLRFASRGGKLIYYHGWSDPFLPALSALAYRDKLEQTMRERRLDDFFRVFMVPGMGHCSGGGADRFGGAGADAPIPDERHDMLSALVEWVEHQNAPDVIVASKLEAGQVTQTHPLCVYPKVAHYRVSGPLQSAESFSCQLAVQTETSVPGSPANIGARLERLPLKGTILRLRHCAFARLLFRKLFSANDGLHSAELDRGPRL